MAALSRTTVAHRLARRVRRAANSCSSSRLSRSAPRRRIGAYFFWRFDRRYWCARLFGLSRPFGIACISSLDARQVRCARANRANLPAAHNLDGRCTNPRLTVGRVEKR